MFSGERNQKNRWLFVSYLHRVPYSVYHSKNKKFLQSEPKISLKNQTDNLVLVLDKKILISPNIKINFQMEDSQVLVDMDLDIIIVNADVLFA